MLHSLHRCGERGQGVPGQWGVALPGHQQRRRLQARLVRIQGAASTTPCPIFQTDQHDVGKREGTRRALTKGPREPQSVGCGFWSLPSLECSASLTAL